MEIITYLWLHPGLGKIPPFKSAFGFNNGFADHKPILLVMVVFIGCQPTTLCPHESNSLVMSTQDLISMQ